MVNQLFKTEELVLDHHSTLLKRVVLWKTRSNSTLKIKKNYIYIDSIEGKIQLY